MRSVIEEYKYVRDFLLPRLTNPDYCSGARDALRKLGDNSLALFERDVKEFRLIALGVHEIETRSLIEAARVSGFAIFGLKQPALVH